MTKEQIQKLYPNNKDPEFERVQKSLGEFDETEKAKEMDKEEI